MFRMKQVRVFTVACGVPSPEGLFLVCLQLLSFFIAWIFFFIITNDRFGGTNLKQWTFLTSNSKGNGTKCHREPPLSMLVIILLARVKGEIATIMKEGAASVRR